MIACTLPSLQEGFIVEGRKNNNNLPNTGDPRLLTDALMDLMFGPHKRAFSTEFTNRCTNPMHKTLDK
jgi:hypothetical protein